MLTCISWTHTEVLARFIVYDTAGLMTIEVSGGDDKFGYIKGKEAVAIEAAWIALRKHEGLGDNAIGINVTEIGACEETIVATGTEHEPARVGAPVVERLGVGGVDLGHRAALARLQVEQIEVGLVVPDAELAVVGECVAEETTVVGGTGERYRLTLSCGVNDDLYLVAKSARLRVEVDAAEVITNRVK